MKRVFQDRFCSIVFFPVFIFLCLPIIPVLDRTVIARDPAPYLCGFSAFRAYLLFPGKVTVLRTDGISRRHRIVRELIVLSYRPYQVCCGFPVRKLFPEKRMEYGPGSIQCLQTVLDIQSVKNISRIIYRQMGGIRIIRSIPFLSRCNDVRELFLIVFCQPISRAFSRSRFKVEQVAVFLLVIGKTFPHMVQDFFGEFLSFVMGQVLPQPACIQPSLIHPDKSDR